MTSEDNRKNRLKMPMDQFLIENPTVTANQIRKILNDFSVDISASTLAAAGKLDNVAAYSVLLERATADIRGVHGYMAAFTLASQNSARCIDYLLSKTARNTDFTTMVSGIAMRSVAKDAAKTFNVALKYGFDLEMNRACIIRLICIRGARDILFVCARIGFLITKQDFFNDPNLLAMSYAFKRHCVEDLQIAGLFIDKEFRSFCTASGWIIDDKLIESEFVQQRRFKNIVHRAMAILCGLQELQVATPSLIAILDFSLPLACLIPFHKKWDLVCAVRHFRQRNPQLPAPRRSVRIRNSLHQNKIRILNED